MHASLEDAPKTSQQDCPSLCSWGPTSYWKGTRAGPPWCFPRGLPGHPARRTEISRATPETLNDLNVANLECEISFSLVLLGCHLWWVGREEGWRRRAGQVQGRAGWGLTSRGRLSLCCPTPPSLPEGGLLAAQVTSSAAGRVHGSALDDTPPCFYGPGLPEAK